MIETDSGIVRLHLEFLILNLSSFCRGDPDAGEWISSDNEGPFAFLTVLGLYGVDVIEARRQIEAPGFCERWNEAMRIYKLEARKKV